MISWWKGCAKTPRDGDWDSILLALEICYGPIGKGKKKIQFFRLTLNFYILLARHSTLYNRRTPRNWRLKHDVGKYETDDGVKS